MHQASWFTPIIHFRMIQLLILIPLIPVKVAGMFVWAVVETGLGLAKGELLCCDFVGWYISRRAMMITKAAVFIIS